METENSPYAAPRPRGEESGSPVTDVVSVRVPEGVLFREVSGEAVVLELTSGQYYGLDSSGTRMWSLLSEHGEVRPVYEILLAEYEVGAEQLRRDLSAFIEELVSHRLLEVDAP